MKIRNYIIGILLGALTFNGATSCSSDFLKEELTTKFSTEYFETAEGLEALTVSLYGHLRGQMLLPFSVQMNGQKVTLRIIRCGILMTIVFLRLFKQ